MQRKNLLLNEVLLREVKQALQAATESEAVNKALEEVSRLVKARDLVHHLGTGIWEGDLSEMRNDRRKDRKPNKKVKA